MGKTALNHRQPSWLLRIARLLIAWLLFAWLLFSGVPFALLTAHADVDVSHYGLLPEVRAAAISPDGEHFAYIRRQQEAEYFVIRRLRDGAVVGGANASDLKARSLYFATNRHVILLVSQTRADFTIRGKWEQSHAAVFDMDTGEIRTLLNRFRGLYKAQSGLGRIVGLDPDGEHIYMPAFMGDSGPRNSLLRASLKTGKGKVYVTGTRDTVDWFMDDAGNVLAREELDNRNNKHIIRARIDGKWKKIYEERTPLPTLRVAGVSADNRHIVFRRRGLTGEAVYYMALADGAVTGPVFAHAAVRAQDLQDDKIGIREIDRVITRGLNRTFLGVRLSGLIPRYELNVPIAQQAVDSIAAQFDGSSVFLTSFTDDWSRILFMVTGNGRAEQHLIFDTGRKSLQLIGQGYPDIDPQDIGEITAIRYRASDGLKITAVMTWPPGVEARSNLPALVLPHGGPERYDSIRFDWWAQYFARKGYLVMQPNFRGSAGQGVAFRQAGQGEWGGRMQDDVSDGVRALVQSGYVDPDRVCIMGASYGGYSALAGGAFSPALYRCIISVAGVADLPKMITDEKFAHGPDHWAVSYMRKVMGDPRRGLKKLRAISPVNAARRFQAPVLLLHGRDDTVVPFRQSKRMQRALQKHDKDVQLTALDGEDHWLSRSETRLAMLVAIDEFLMRHNPPGPVAAKVRGSARADPQ